MSSHDIPDAGLIDISGLSLHELIAEADESGLGSALRRILAPQGESTHRRFQSTI